MILKDLVSGPTVADHRGIVAEKPTAARFRLLIVGLALIKLAVHFFTNTNYGLHRDEYLYLAVADHLDFGFASVPPLIGVISGLTQALFGDSLFAVRLFPALVGALSVIIIGLIVREMDGKNWAVLLAGSAFILSPAFLRSNTLLMPVSFNQFFWLLSAYFIARMISSEDPKYWIHLGITWGVGFLNKYSIAFFALAFLIALCLTPQRRLFRSRQFFWGAALGFIIILPNIFWQWGYDWPVIHHLLTLQQTQLVNVRLGDFLLMQILMNIHALPIWLFGAIFLLILAPGKRWRALGFTFVGVMALLILFRGKHYYTLGIYPLLFAAGGVSVEYYFKNRLALARPLFLGLMALNVLPVLPYSLPLLSYPQMAAYAQATKSYGLAGALMWEDGEIHQLPQDYADMTGWKALGDLVINVYQQLSPAEQRRCVIYGENYGHAGAIKYFGRKKGLPEPISFSDSFLHWAPDSIAFDVLIYVNHQPGEDVLRSFGTVEKAGQVNDEYFRENGLGIYVCRQPNPAFFDHYRRKVAGLKSRLRAKRNPLVQHIRTNYPCDPLAICAVEIWLNHVYIGIVEYRK